MGAAGAAVAARGRFGWAAATKTGPNDASGVVWAIGAHLKKILVLFILINVFLQLTGFLYILCSILY
jgi:hypothetical protein